MDSFQLIAVILAVTSIFSFFNHKFLKLPVTIGVMIISLLFSFLVLVLGMAIPGLRQFATDFVNSLDFDHTLMYGLLSFLLFAGALEIDLNNLSRQKSVIISLASAGVLISTFLFGTAIYYVFDILGIGIDYIYCLLFGSLISPTDPIAVLGILKRLEAPESIETKIAGESLFNDGVGVVVFLVLSGIAYGGEEVSFASISGLFALEALGGIAFGLLAGYFFYRMLKAVDNYQVEIMLTLALVTGTYALAMEIHISGPIAIVVAGLLIGNHGRMFAMSEKTRQNLDHFWEMTDEILNAVLFVLIGLEVLVISFSGSYLLAGVIAIPIILLVRLASVSLPISILKFYRKFSKGVVSLLVWGGLRGGISVALALSLPQSRERDIILTATFIIVVFSIIFQGLSINKVAGRILEGKSGE